MANIDGSARKAVEFGDVRALHLGVANIKAESFKRTLSTYPFSSSLQWIRAGYGFLLSLLLILFGGWRSLVSPVIIEDFIASYISVRIPNTIFNTVPYAYTSEQVALFCVITLLYLLKSRGINPSEWQLQANRFTNLGHFGPVVLPDPGEGQPQANQGDPGFGPRLRVYCKFLGHWIR
jgi:hypothetical protein